MLNVDHLHAYYGLSHVLQGVTLRVGTDEVVGLFGRNGVGKTTVLKCIAGWVKPSSGSIHFENAELGSLSSDRICRSGLGFVPEDRRIFPGFTVEENLKLGFLQCPKRSAAKSKQALEQTYEQFPVLKDRRKQVAVTLSGGEQQMLAIARALVGAPKLLLIDEPTEGLAPMIVDEIFATIDHLRREGIPILLVEQKVYRALDITDRFYVLERGRVILQGESSSPADRQTLFRAIEV